MAFTLLNPLNAFIVVARRLSYAAAARDLGVSTSALSQSVRQLEERLGVALLTRTSRSVALTDAGHRLLDNAGPAVDQALESLKTVRAKRGEVTGRVRLSVPSASVSMVLADLLPRFIARYPKVGVEVHVDDRFVNTVAGEFDAGMRLIESIDRDMVHVRLSGPTRLVVVGAPSYFERKGVPQKPQDLLQHDCICIRRSPSGEPWAWELERGKKTYRVPVRGPVTTNDAELMRTMAVAGVGLFYSLERRVESDLTTGRLRVVLEPYTPEVPGLYLYFPKRSQVSPALKAFVEVAREQVKADRAGGAT
ncbi:LysR family transcriptional regulator [Hyalangium minutum]|uniref:Transcriptional regulator, LysR family protein n=1 Tax=Hyalangium minutum TaxID=394096 RepID=A0A085VZ29_9BACT|nr:LysR family transcriptional regulator [Hyalangium minutum]KFE58454.1 Transcriptional regulator, LysR family protein [Hyalangium minutum]KFE60692.1 Transcriptional regulator, LysR family protein [Hyalangium minutum]